MFLYLIYVFVVLAVLTKIAYTDYKHYLVDDWYIFLGLLLVFIYQAIAGDFCASFFGSIISGSICFCIFIVVNKLYKSEALGDGDITLLMLLGAVYGTTNLWFLVVWGNIIACIGAILLIATKRKKLRDHVPLAPFYVLTTYIFFLKDFFSFF